MRFLVAVLLLASPASADGAPASGWLVERARPLFEAGRYNEALALTEAAESSGKHDRKTLLALLEIRAQCLSALKQAKEATIVWRRYFALDPGRGPPEVDPLGAAAAARQWVQVNGVLVSDATVSQTREALVALTIRVADPVGVTDQVRVHFREDGGPWKERTLTRAGGTVELAGTGVEYHYELIDRRGSTLLEKGSAAAPLHASLSEAPAVTAPAANEERPSLAPQPQGPVEAPPSEVAPVAQVERVTVSHRWRYVGLSLLAGGAVAAALGSAWGVASRRSREEFQRAVQEAGGGAISMLTRARALELQTSVANNAVVANALFIAAGCLALAGFGLMLFDVITVTPSPQGVAVAGRMP